MQFTLETEKETDSNWIAEVVEIPGVMKCGTNRQDAIRQAQALALRVIGERIKAGEQVTAPIEITFAA